MNIKFKKITPDAIAPEYKTSGAAAADLCTNETVTIKAGKAGLIPLGIAVEIPDDHMILLALRSSTPMKKGLLSPHGMGIIDSDYTGELKLLVAPIGNEDITIEKGERIAQMAMIPCRNLHEANVEITGYTEVEHLKDTARADGSFGSTDK